MTPPPATAAASGHQRTVRRGTSPRGPRRVSGPARTPKGRASAQPKARVSPNQLTIDQLPLRAGAVALPAPADSLGPRLVRGFGAVAGSRWLDRLLTGRTWIVLVALGLIGLVFMQVSLLKINSGMGSAVERSAELERQNSTLRAEVAQLDATERLQAEAIKLGLVLPTAGAVTFLGERGRRVGGDAPTIVPSEAAASTAVLPTLPGESTEHPEAAVASDPAAATTATAPPATTSTLDPSLTTTTPPPATPTAPAPAPAPVAAATPAPAAAPETTTPPVSAAGGAAVPE